MTSRDLPLVVSSGVCVGCGACAVTAPEHLEMRLTERGEYLPFARDGRELDQLDEQVLADTSKVCPFSNSSRDEDAIGADLYAGDGASHHEVVGHSRKIVAGHVAGGDFRDRGTSGGMTSWVLHRLLSSGEIDAVVHVASTLEGLPNPLSRYTISRSVEELLSGRKSRYHVQTLADVMEDVRQQPGRYAVVGVPCFIKAVRLLTDADEVLRERITFTSSLVCGHYKSTLYSEYVGWSAGIQPTNLLDIDYRHKEPGRPPNRYCVRATPREGEDVVLGVEHIPMADWGMGIFKLGACDYCDDIVGETADISLGDAWLDPFMADWQGANLAIARSELAARMLEEGEADGELDVIPWTAEDVAAAQAGAVRHRRPGLAVRLGNRARQGIWAPTKRVEPLAESELDSPFSQRMLNREAISIASPATYLEARRRGDLDYFRRTMKPLVQRYDGTRVTTFWRRAAAKIAHRLPPKGEAFLRRIVGRQRQN
ncbi:Coenzyme F420 hydrogenase/dehydrogenase, beta subunit C-terminal domain [Marmoricola sp. URHB0036]|uniref:Coenzyme F420 hydrogenase/dehydrogenase, beta subunit C-terminal domain n=1 Tax=Marmoricola sp. URHB0036 TaxID=1298863 RepID=UPI0012DD433D|nr:Coenzyme F420 hydrogenase/dehydrogenase, beta subunit C-terminal domain [Marmoricola sp. URHB0036]